MAFSFKKFFKPGFFVCEWNLEGGGQSGDFATIGETKETAIEDAIKYLQGINVPPGVITFEIRKPTIKERIYAARN